MLNLSENGLACRMAADQAVRLRVGQALSVRYALPAVSNPFLLDARVVNVTPGGDPACSIVGVEFLFPRAAEPRRRLRQALDRMSESPEAPWLE